jgi:hypothetical protein
VQGYEGDFKEKVETAGGLGKGEVLDCWTYSAQRLVTKT